MKIQDVFSAYKDDLQKVEKCINDNVTSEIKLIPEVANHLINSGGKRFRPLLLLICAHLCGYQGGNRFPMATVMEFIHTATLLHDDVIDQASIRRGKDSANKIFGNSVSILVGDFLCFKAFMLMSAIGNNDIFGLVSEMGNIMSEGEVFQLTKCGDVSMTRDEYLSIIEKKTAVLISASCAAGAIMGSASQKKIDALARFGRNAGMAFQITDDVLDYMAKGDDFGKSIGKDLEEGKITLPLIFAINESSEEEKNKIKEIITLHKSSKKAVREIIRLIKKYNGIDSSLQAAAGYISEAKSQLSIFSDCPEKDHLNTVTDYILSRNL
ncbi:MAG TPA: octaprenyl diphosphate synthase [Smithella sp.]|jgi:octaprenyl-diphosphate synthase|nr:octaprenyl diphosphate synthase [Smithella sp.]